MFSDRHCLLYIISYNIIYNMSYYIPHVIFYTDGLMFTAYDFSYLTENHLLPQFMQTSQLVSLLLLLPFFRPFSK